MFTYLRVTDTFHSELGGRSLKAGMMPMLYLFLNKESHQFIDDNWNFISEFTIIEYEFNEKYFWEIYA